MFTKILIANRGEIACRIIRTAKQLGITCVAVYSEADAKALYVQLADEAYFLGPSVARESYLHQDKILAIAEEAGVQAIHPGYGFLSENPEFAAQCKQKGICFIGPSAEVIAAMGSKSAAKKIMHEAGIPLIAGYHGEDQSVDCLIKKAQEIGYPVLIKASAGGGGKGMRMVPIESEFTEALEEVKRQALKAFGDDAVILEKYVLSPRHIEVQIFADNYGNSVHLFERDCSIQRRYQKIIEETPAPHFSEALRQQATHFALLAVQAVQYVGAGTVEFLLDDDQIYFMEMNTRLQVEHAITEKITGIDLVEWQLRIAAGEALPLTQSGIACHGYAIEARVCAEDPAKKFLPAAGDIGFLSLPEETVHLRVDSGIASGDTITTHYDSMLSKLIAWGETRKEAISQLNSGLAQYHLAGVATNLIFLKRILQEPDFLAEKIDTHFIADHWDSLVAQPPAPSSMLRIAAAIYTAIHQVQRAKISALATQDPYSPWASYENWRLNEAASQVFHFLCQEEPIEVGLLFKGENQFEAQVKDRNFQVTAVFAEENHFSICILQPDADGYIQTARYTYPVTAVFCNEELHVWIENEAVIFKPCVSLSSEQAHHHASQLCAPLPGTVIALCVKEGALVEAGERLVVIEAMKMEHTIRAPSRGIVKAWHFKLGDLVSEGAELLAFESREEFSE
jgi:3-methylcrotonyl-CoA carboxylase alpha subunit